MRLFLTVVVSASLLGAEPAATGVTESGVDGLPPGTCTVCQCCGDICEGVEGIWPPPPISPREYQPCIPEFCRVNACDIGKPFGDYESFTAVEAAVAVADGPSLSKILADNRTWLVYNSKRQAVQSYDRCKGGISGHISLTSIQAAGLEDYLSELWSDGSARD